MNPSTTALTLNMQLPNIATVAWAVQGDQGSRQIQATLVDGSSAWNPQAGYDGVIRFFKPDGTNGVYDVDEDGNPAVTWSGNVATLAIAQQAVTVVGTVLMQLEFYDSNNARISTFGWAMNVQPSAVTDTEFLSTDYYSILTAQISAVLGATAHPPYINSSTKNWMIWDEDLGGYADSGYSSVGLTGPYFTPAVDAAGNISWTNNGGLPNPTSQNIKGPQGVSISGTSKASGTGAPGTTDVYNVNLSNGTVGGTFNVYNGADGQGSPGSQTPQSDTNGGAVGSANAYAREDHRHELNVASSGSPSDLGAVASLGAAGTYARTDHVHKSPVDSFTVTLSAASWSSNQQTVSDAKFINSGYVYQIAPDSSSFLAYCEAQIYADAVSTTGQMTFHCVNVPSSNLIVIVQRSVAAS